MQWSRERCKFNLIIVARDYNNTMVVNYIYIVLQSHWKGFGRYSFFYIGLVYVFIFYTLFWRLSVCIYICMCVCIYIYAVCVCVFVYIYMYIYICMYMYIHVCICICIYIYVCVCACMNHSRRCFFIGSDISNLTKMRFELSLLMGGMSPWVVLYVWHL